jgi:hypothetical protein
MLEKRDVPSCTAMINAGAVQVICTGGPDTVIIDHIGSTEIVITDGTQRSFQDSNYGKTYLTGGTNGLTATVRGTVKELDLADRHLNDPVNIGNTSNQLTGIVGLVLIGDGNYAGSAVLTVHDEGDTVAHTATVATGNQYQGLPAGSVSGVSGGGLIQWTYERTPSATVNLGSGTSTVNVRGVGVPTTVQNRGAATVNVGDANSLAGITAPLTVSGEGSMEAVNLNDGADAANRGVGISNDGITGLAPAAITPLAPAALNVNGGSGNNNYSIAETNGIAVTLDTGSGIDTTNIEFNNAPLMVKTTTGGGGGGNDVVNFGYAGSLVGITAPVTVSNSQSQGQLNIDDSADAAGLGVNIGSGGITGMHSAPLNFSAASVNALTVNGGTGNNFYVLAATPASTSMTLNAGAGTTDSVSVQATSVPLVVNATGSRDVVALGDSSNSTAGLTGPVTLTNPSGFLQVSVSDGADAVSRAVTISAGGITGLAPAALNFSAASVNALTVNGGTAASTYTITDTPASQSTTLRTGTGGNTVTVQGNATPLILNTGANDTVLLTNGAGGNVLDPIGAVTVNDPSSTSAVVLDDSGFGGGDTYTITNATVTIARSATFAFTYSGLGSLTLNGGSAASVFAIDSSSAPTTVNGGAGGNTFRISPFTQYLAGSILGPLTLNGGGADILEFFDVNDPNSETFTFDAVPMSLTLGSTGGTIAVFGGMAGGIYVETNGFSTPNDQSGTVIFDNGPPPQPGIGSPSGGGATDVPASVRDAAWLAPATTDLRGGDAPGWVWREVRETREPVALIDQLFSL